MSSTLARTRHRGDRPSIHGRERERAQLQELLDDAIAGHGALALISGEAGIGKTTLVNDLVYEAEQQGCLILTGGCHDLTTSSPYGPWVEITRSYRDDARLPPLPDQFRDGRSLTGIASQADLFLLLSDFFEAVAAVNPLLIVLEDLHWSDPASLELLRFQARNIADRPILIAATYRDDEITRQHELFRILPLLTHEPAVSRLSVRPLGQSAISLLIAARYPLEEAEHARLTEHLHERADGNPFFVVELLDALEAEGSLYTSNGRWKLGDLTGTGPPALVSQVIERRLERLDPDSRPLFQIAAIIGQDVPLDLWKTVADVSGTNLDEAVEPALESRLIDELPDGSGFQFHHALIREVLYGSTMLNRRRELHREVGEALLKSLSPDPDEIVHHFQQANDPRAIDWLIRAGNRAERRYALRTTIDHFDAALVLIEETEDSARIRGWLHFRLARLKGPHALVPDLTHSDEALRLAGLA